MINRKNIDQSLRSHLKKDISPKLTICTDKEKNLDDIDIISLNSRGSDTSTFVV